MSFYGVSPVAFESVSNVTATNSVELGTRRIEANEEYVYCLNGMASSATQGVLMIQSATSGYTMSRSSLAAADLPMVAVKHAAVPSGSYFWGLTRGSLLACSLAVTAGDMLTIGLNGALQTYAVGSFPTGPLIGKVQLTGTAATTVACFVSLYG
jgi:hypothetical protein